MKNPYLPPVAAILFIIILMEPQEILHILTNPEPLPKAFYGFMGDNRETPKITDKKTWLKQLSTYHSNPDESSLLEQK